MRRGGQTTVRALDQQRMSIALGRIHLEAAAAEHLGPAAVLDAALERLHVDEARKALVGGAAHPPLRRLGQSRGHLFVAPFRSGVAGCPLLTPRPSQAAAREGERPCWW